MKHPRTRTLPLFSLGLLVAAYPQFVACGESGVDDGASLDRGDGDETAAGDGDSDNFGGEGGLFDMLVPEPAETGGEGPVELPTLDEAGDITLPSLVAPPPCGLANTPYLIGGNVNASGYLHVQDDISDLGTIALGAITHMDGATSHTVLPDGTAFVSYWEEPVIEKWEVGPMNAIEKTGSLNLANAGVSSTGSFRQLVHVMGNNRAYYIDPENNHVLGFNPNTMQANGVFIDLTEGFGPAVDTMALGDVHRDGDHLIVSARYWDEDWNVESIIRAAFIDSNDDSVTFAEETRCGDVAWHATDSSGNLYLGSHFDNVGANYVEDFGVTGTDSCIVRIRRGERRFDPNYYVDMDALLGGIGTTLLQGPGDQAYVMKYAGDPITRDNWDEVRGGATWELFAITLGDEENSLTQVDLGGAKFSPTPTLFCADNTQSIIGLSGTDFADGQLFVIDTGDNATAALSYSGALGEGASLD